MPISPRSAAVFSAAKFGSKRRLKPIITGRPVAPATFWQACARARLRSTGFSQRTALPAFVAASIRSEWVLVGGRDQDCVDRGVADDRLVASGLCAICGGKLCGRLRVDVRYGDEPALPVGGNSLGVNVADAAGAKETNFEHGSFPLESIALICVRLPDAPLARPSNNQTVKADRKASRADSASPEAKASRKTVPR